MQLYIDTSDNKKLIVKFGKEEIVRLIEVGETQQLLSMIDKMIKKTDGSINQIKVNLGPGSFTGLRVGVTIANALGWTWQIPVNGKKQIVIPNYE